MRQAAIAGEGSHVLGADIARESARNFVARGEWRFRTRLGSDASASDRRSSRVALLPGALVSDMKIKRVARPGRQYEIDHRLRGMTPAICDLRVVLCDQSS